VNEEIRYRTLYIEGCEKQPHTGEDGMSQNQQQDYTVESEGGLEYVVVRCPKGHRLRGMKTSEIKAWQEVACPECTTKTRWMVLAPLTNGMEACV
jgi:hypothetical protein